MKKRFKRAYVEITNVCNLSCSFCPGTGREAGFMGVEQFRAAAQELILYTDYIYLHVMGEPLLHPQLSEIIDTAEEIGFKVSITTNGTLLHERMQELVTRKIYKISISLHSYEANEGADPREYVRECLDFTRRAAGNGTICVLRLWNLGDGRNRENEIILGELGEYFRILPPEPGVKAKLTENIYIDWDSRFDWPMLSAPDYGEECFCLGLREQIAVLVDGTVVPCCLDKDGVSTLGNIYSTPLGDILASPKAEAIYDGFSRRKAVEKLCRHCAYAHRRD